MEQWATVAVNPRYSVSTTGRVRRDARAKGTLSGRILKTLKMPNGYLMVRLHSPAGGRAYYVHRLVAAAFVGDPSGIDVCHIDGTRDNNVASNLRLDTRKGNMSDQLVHGTRMRGEAHHLKKYTDAEMLAACQRVWAGEFMRVVAELSGIKYGTLKNAQSGASPRWKRLFASYAAAEKKVAA